MKYIELFKNGFDSTISEKIKPENWPYIGYSPNTGFAFSVISEEPTSTYQMVDLGLPSGLKWADRNVGASSPEDNGLYFDWGNVDGHTVNENGKITDGYLFNDNTYSATLGGQYTSSELDAEHDAATVNMGSDWRMPTSVETCELVQNTDHYYINLEGNIINKDGFIIDENGNITEDKIGLGRSKKLRSVCFVKKGDTFKYNDRSNFIEFPIAGILTGSSLSGNGEYGRVRTSSTFDDDLNYAPTLYFSNTGSLSGENSDFRCHGHSVRGVHV